MPVGQRQTIEEYKAVLVGEPKIFLCELLERNVGRAVVVYRLRRAVQVEDIRMPAGTVSYGYFWETRNYNVYHFVDDARQTLGLYFNIGDSTRISETQIYWRDLIVDILVTPDGRSRVLDQHELPADLSQPLRRLIFDTRDYILERVTELKAEIEGQTRLFSAQR